MNIPELENPRTHKTPRRLDHGNAAEHIHRSAEELYRQNVFAGIDKAVSEIKEIFSSENLEKYLLYEMLLTGKYKAEVASVYPELLPSLEQNWSFSEAIKKPSQLRSTCLCFRQ